MFQYMLNWILYTLIHLIHSFGHGIFVEATLNSLDCNSLGNLNFYFSINLFDFFRKWYFYKMRFTTYKLNKIAKILIFGSWLKNLNISIVNLKSMYLFFSNNSNKLICFVECCRILYLADTSLNLSCNCDIPAWTSQQTHVDIAG